MSGSLGLSLHCDRDSRLVVVALIVRLMSLQSLSEWFIASLLICYELGVGDKFNLKFFWPSH